MQTPVYLFSPEKIRNNFRALERAMPLCELYYALKANSEIEVLKVLKDVRASFDVASEEEWLKLIHLGVSPNLILCSLPVKAEEMIGRLYQGGCMYFVFDHFDEFIKLERYAPQASKILRLYVADLGMDRIQYGMTIDEFSSMVEKHPDYVGKIDGITFYTRGCENINVFEQILERCDLVFSKLSVDRKLILDIGGGYRLTKETNGEYFVRLTENLRRLGSKYNLRFIAEPGRGVISSAGVLLTKVIMVKEKKGYFDVYLDAGEPTGVIDLPTSIRKYVGQPTPLQIKQIYRFISITCNHQVLFTLPLKFAPQKDDILLFEGYGAYSICHSSQFHSWKKPEVILEEF